MKKHYRHEHDCLNCGSELQGKFCHNCGQENLQIKESFGHMLNHAVSDYFHFDHQFFHTLKPLLLKPGLLTIEYMKGRRAQYLHPVKMYIFISLVFFVLIFKSKHSDGIIKVDETDNPKTKKEIADKVKKKLISLPSISEATKAEINQTVDSSLKEAKTEEGDIKTPKKKQKWKGSILSITNKGDSDTTLAQYNVTQSKLPADERDNWFERFVQETGYAYQAKYGEHSTEQFIEDCKHNIPKMMFVLLPLFALILKTTFWRNHKFYVEHIIYSIHLHCFFFLFSAIILLIQMALPESWSTLSNWLTALLWLYSIYYIYRSLRVLYNRRRWVTLWKMFTMSIWYWSVFIVCMMGLVMATAASHG